MQRYKEASYLTKLVHFVDSFSIIFETYHDDRDCNLKQFSNNIL